MESEISEQQWVTLLAEGNEDAYKYFFDKHYGGLVRYLYTLLDNTQAAEDQVTDIFVKLWEKRRDFSFKDPKHVESTLYLISKWGACTYLRNNKRRTGKQNAWLDLHTGEKDDFLDVIDKEELISMMLEVIYRRAGDLSPRCREVFEMRYDIGLSVSEIAERLDMTEQNVLNHSAKAVGLLRKYLKENGLSISLLIFFLRR